MKVTNFLKKQNQDLTLIYLHVNNSCESYLSLSEERVVRIESLDFLQTFEPEDRRRIL